MIDIQLIREDATSVSAALSTRGESFDLSPILSLDRERRKVLTEVEEKRSTLNSTSKEIGKIKKAGGNADEVMEKMKVLRDEISNSEARLNEISDELQGLLMNIPNLPLQDVPRGADEEDNPVIREWGELPKFDFQPKAHDDLGRELGVMSGEVGVKLAKGRFTLLRGGAAKLERALINFMLDMHSAKGYEECLPPFLANTRTMTGTGQLPKFRDQLFAIEGEDLFLIPTAEVPLTNIVADEVLRDLPEGKVLKFAAYTPCFRSEAGSHGQDVKGYIRQHQFNKVEIVKICRPEDSFKEHESLTADAEAVLRELKLPYRVVDLCTGDLGFSSARTYDIEVWLPSQNRYREISSCSTFTDFQARRAGIRYRDHALKKNFFAHTLNGSGLAVGRTLIAIFENGQTHDGDVILPEAIRPYLGGAKSIRELG